MSFALGSPLAGTTVTLAGLFAPERSLDIGSLMSPAALVMAFCAIGYIWSYWSLRCLRYHAFEYGRSEPLIRLMTSHDERLAGNLAAGLGSTIHPTGGYFVIPLVTVLAALLTGEALTRSVEGRSFAFAIVSGSTLGLLGVAVEGAQAAWLRWRLKETLQQLRLHPLSRELAERAKDPFDWGISFEPRFGLTPRMLRDRLTELGQTVDALCRTHGVAKTTAHCAAEGERRREIPTQVKAPKSPQPEMVSVAARQHVRSNDLAWVVHCLGAAPAPRHGVNGATDRNEADLPLPRTELWRTAVQVANHVIPAFDARHFRHSQPLQARTDLKAYFEAAERFVSLVVVLIPRTIVVRVVRGLGIALILASILFVGHVLYTFPGRHFWLTLDSPCRRWCRFSRPCCSWRSSGTRC